MDVKKLPNEDTNVYCPSFCNRFWVSALILGLAVCSTMSAADPAFVGKLAIAVSDDGVMRLGLSDEVKRKLVELIDRREREALSTALEIKDLPSDEIAARLAPFVAESERQGMSLLTVEQRAQLDQMKIAQAGMASLADREMAKLLDLSEEQQNQIQELLSQRTKSLTRGGENERRITRGEFERQLAGVLNADQRATWEKLAGLSAGQPKATENNTLEAKPAAELKPALATVASTDTLDKEQSQKKKNTGPPASEPTATVDPASERDTRPWAEGEVRLTFNFHHAPWKDVLEWLAEEADLALQADSPPTGTCNYRDSRSYTTAQAIDIINRMLVIKGYMLVRHERLLMLHNLEDPLPPLLVELVPLNELDQRGEFELVKCLFPLSKLEPAEAEAEIAKLVGPQGSIVSLPKSRQLLVTETAGRLRAIKAVFDEVEHPGGSRTESIREITLKHVGVEDFLTIARQLLGLPEGQNASNDLKLAVDPFAPRIFATGTPDAIRRLEETVPLVDRPTSITGGPFKPLEQPQVETYNIVKADPTTVYNVMASLLAGKPEVRLSVDPVNKKLIALACPTDHGTIIETLKQLEGDADQIEVIQLRRLDPQLVILSINKLFNTGNEKEKNATTGPKVDGDPTSMKLWVRGTREQIAQIRDLVEKLEGPSAQQGATERQGLRFLPFTGGSAKSTLESIEALWPAVRTNRIRVVVPSAISPALRKRTPTEDAEPSAEQPSATRTLRLPAGAIPLRGAANSEPAIQPAKPIRAPGDAKRDKSTQVAKPSSLQFVSFQGDEPAAAGDADAEPDEASRPQSAPAAESQAESENKPASKSNDAQDSASKGKPADIIVTVTPQGIFIASQDLDALDDLEKLIQLYKEQQGLRTGEPTVFWLKYARAEIAAELLQQVLTGGTGTSSGGGGGSLIGDVAQNMLGDSGGLLGGLLGLGGSSGSSTYTGPTTIVPDVRLNALIVQGRPQDIMLIEQLLPIVDREASPEEVLTIGKPRLIPVIYMPAEDMANIVRQVYVDRVAGANANQQRQPNPEDFIRALRGGGGRSRNENRGEVAKMSIGVDTRSNSLVVAAPDTLFHEVETLVAQLDHEGAQTDDSMTVVTIKNTNASVLQKALVSITGGQVKANTQTGSPTSSSPSSSSQASQSGQPSAQQGQFNPDDIRRRIEFFRSLQGGGGDGGQRGFMFGPGGGGFAPPGGFNRGGGGFGPPGGGDRGGGDRGGGDRGGGDRGGGNRSGGGGGGGGDRRGR